MIDAHNKRDSMYRSLRKAQLQLMDCQRKLNIPTTTYFEEEPEAGEAKTYTGAGVTDASMLLARELLKSKVARLFFNISFPSLIGVSGDS